MFLKKVEVMYYINASNYLRNLIGRIKQNMEKLEKHTKITILRNLEITPFVWIEKTEIKSVKET